MNNMARKYTHTDEFYRKRFKKYIKLVRQYKPEYLPRNRQAIEEEYRLFKLSWEDSNVKANRTEALAWDATHSVSKRMSKAAYRVLKLNKELPDGIQNFEQLAQLNHAQLAELMHEDINTFYRKCLEEGKSKAEIRRLVSQQFFGSL